LFGMHVSICGSNQGEKVYLLYAKFSLLISIIASGRFRYLRQPSRINNKPRIAFMNLSGAWKAGFLPEPGSRLFGNHRREGTYFPQFHMLVPTKTLNCQTFFAWMKGGIWFVNVRYQVS
jgi:hypothetical protein